MLMRGVDPNEHTVASILAACCPLVVGEQIHGYMIKTMGSPSTSVYASSALMDFYLRNGELDMAKMVFNDLQCNNVVAWCSMMHLHIRARMLEDVLQLFDDMLSDAPVQESSMFDYVSCNRQHQSPLLEL